MEGKRIMQLGGNLQSPKQFSHTFIKTTLHMYPVLRTQKAVARFRITQILLIFQIQLLYRPTIRGHLAAILPTQKTATMGHIVRGVF